VAGQEGGREGGRRDDLKAREDLLDPDKMRPMHETVAR